MTFVVVLSCGAPLSITRILKAYLSTVSRSRLPVTSIIADFFWLSVVIENGWLFATILPFSSVATTDKAGALEDPDIDESSIALLEQDSSGNNNTDEDGCNNKSCSTSSNKNRNNIIPLLHVSLSDFVKKYKQFFKSRSIRALSLNVFLYGSIMCIPDTFFFVSLEKEYHSSRTFNGKYLSSFILSRCAFRYNSTS